MSCTVMKERMKPPRGLFDDLSDMACTSYQWVGRAMTPTSGFPGLTKKTTGAKHHGRAAAKR